MIRYKHTYFEQVIKEVIITHFCPLKNLFGVVLGFIDSFKANL